MKPKTETTKICSKCGKAKPAGKKHFYAMSKAKDGLQKMCKVCFDVKYGPDKKPAQKT